MLTNLRSMINFVIVILYISAPEEVRCIHETFWTIYINKILEKWEVLLPLCTLSILNL